MSATKDKKKHQDRNNNDSHLNGSLLDDQSVASHDDFDDDETTAHNWQYYKRRNKRIYDDRTMTYFWRTHTITGLVLVLAVFFYVALFENQTYDTKYNTKRGIVACTIFYLLFGVLFTPDGPFCRPHPALWRFVLCFSTLYEMALVYILFQNVDDARKLLKEVDTKLGIPLPDKDYGGSCLIYDPEKPEDPFHNFWDKIDVFVPTHFFGWWLKTLILRDYWICMVFSIGFEILEYSLQHQLPNFSECWWDHWILDFAVCNMLGIYFGMKTCEYFTMKPYNWRGMWNIPTFKGKMVRVVTQFSPYSWIEYDWRPTASLKRWFAMIIISVLFFLAELGNFYLKFILWVPASHNICLARVLFILLGGGVAMRESFEYLDNPYCKKFGKQAWMMILIVLTEWLIVLKFDWNLVMQPFPRHVAIFWTCFISLIVLWTIWHFYIKAFLHWNEKKQNSPPSKKPNSIKNKKS